jgi:hypothetical protein
MRASPEWAIHMAPNNSIWNCASNGIRESLGLKRKARGGEEATRDSRTKQEKTKSTGTKVPVKSLRVSDDYGASTGLSAPIGAL